MPGQGFQRVTLQVEKLDSRACPAGTHPAACGRRALGASLIAIVGIREALGVLQLPPLEMSPRGGGTFDVKTQ